jgi:hypothetical protein
VIPSAVLAPRPRLSLTGAKYICDGNSQTEGVNGAAVSYPGQLATLLGATVTNRGVGGADLDDMLATAPAQIDAAFQVGLNVLTVGEVRNQIVNADQAANARTAVDKLWQYCDARRAAATGGKVLRIVVWNILPTARTNASIGLAAVQALFATANGYIGNEWRAHADRFVNVYSEPPLSDPDNTIYFPDQVHGSIMADLVLAQMVYAAIRSLR